METVMLERRVGQALALRRDALRYLRRGDRQMHRLIMKETRLPLLQARQWKVKQ
jgi:hypothetical protein